MPMRTTCEHDAWFACIAIVNLTHLNRAEDPKNKRLHHGKGGSADAEHEIEAKIPASIEIGAVLGVLV